MAHRMAGLLGLCGWPGSDRPRSSYSLLRCVRLTGSAFLNRARRTARAGSGAECVCANYVPLVNVVQ
eukprot:scaffold39571_cov39-Tisochrysis_lutea.AAC.1